MSDAKARRTARESERSEIAAAEAGQGAPVTASTAAPIVIAEPAPPAPAEAEILLIAPEPVAPTGPESIKAAQAPADDAWVAVAALQSALARGFAEAAVEMAELTKSGIAAAADAATAMLGARTFAEAVEINAGLIRRRTDAMIDGSARLSEIGVRVVTEASQPILARFGIARGGGAIG